MREYKIDNIKGILIFLVVLGHVLERCMGYGCNRYLYYFIYSFHIPVFVFTTGYFARFQRKKIIKNMLGLYIVFQLLYQLFLNVVMGTPTSYQISNPYWLTWYLLSMAVWTTALLFVDSGKSRIRVFVWLVSVAIAVGAGFDNSVGRLYSASRICTFFPFFLLGYNIRQWHQEGKIRVTRGLQILFGVMMAVVAVGYYFYQENIQLNWVYEASAYAVGKYPFGFRIAHIMIGFIFTAGFLLLIPNKKLPILSVIGRNTLWVYLLHGFPVLLLKKYQIMQMFKHQTLAAVLISAALVFVLSFLPVRQRAETKIRSLLYRFSNRRGSRSSESRDLLS